MSGVNPSDDDVVVTVLSIEGCPVEEGQCSLSHDDIDVSQEVVGELLAGGVDSVCCLFAGRLAAPSSDALNTLVEIILSEEFREYFIRIFLLTGITFLGRCRHSFFC